ncbi:GTP-binding protein [Symbiobacterium thermophilum]|uniref:Probable GTP-binding protein EngB n=1 Tax=Symbiobacterium thermophilum (strain DSM 24528 / JCM 14929 / IAM 14863 / T) TaxID=292459 RepID=ENGB_SYMTH|nr:GTP-binding protein [Symbiobacterium thermophilum]Q67SJ6.1 RecName: Full=Probable GTP-binding protein EngB [Symbiobacterium thermophilum IAM 14863]BAD39347.1 GTP-binding protein [Symbiobacterium thermophilum IAM 14863]
MGVHAEFVLSAVAQGQFPQDGLPEVALVGRSNVGKSSLINALVRNRKLARTSNTPGRTQALNFYRVWPQGKPRPEGEPQPDKDAGRTALSGPVLQAARESGAFYLVDMPGYGFARVSEAQRREWARLIEGYLLTRGALRGVLQIVDLRHPPTRDDVTMREWIRHHRLPSLCVATKADKIGRTAWPRHRQVIARELGLDGDGEPLVLFSAETGLGRDDVWRWIREHVQDWTFDM